MHYKNKETFQLAYHSSKSQSCANEQTPRSVYLTTFHFVEGVK